VSINHYEELNGGDDRKILTYALFSGNKWEPSIGAGSLIASADTINELKELQEVTNCEDWKQWQIIDTATFKITDAGDNDGPTVVDGKEI
jgi:hypothetical protein